MARYIDADKFTERIKVSPAFCNINDGLLLQRVVIDLLNNAPTADVVPKSEFAREIFAEIDDLLEGEEKRYEDLSDEVDDPRFVSEYWETALTISSIRTMIAKLKKKYTEEKE